MTRHSTKPRSAWRTIRYTVLPLFLLAIAALIWLAIALAVPFLPAIMTYGILDFIRAFWVTNCEPTNSMIRIAKAVYGMSFLSWAFFQSLLTYLIYKWWSNQ